MKKVILLITVFAIAAASNLVAQNSDTADLAVTATVVNALSVEATDVAFGDVDGGVSAHVNAGTGDATTSANASAPTAGSISIEGNNNGTVFVSWGTGTLTDSDGNNPTTFTPTVVFSGSALSNEDSVTLDGDGEAELGVGGTLAAITGGTGLFSTAHDNGSAVTFTVQYNSF